MIRRVLCKSLTAISILFSRSHRPWFQPDHQDVLDVLVAYLGSFENLPGSTFGKHIKKARWFHGYTKKKCTKQLGGPFSQF